MRRKLPWRPSAAVGAPAGPPPFAWHEHDALAGLLAPHGFEVAVAQERFVFTAKSPRDYLDAESANHPLAVAGRAVLEPRGEAEAPTKSLLRRGFRRIGYPDRCKYPMEDQGSRRTTAR